MKHKPIEIGDEFGRLTVIKFDHKDKKGNPYWLCIDDNFNTKIIRDDNLKNNKTNKINKTNKYEILDDKIKAYTSKGEIFYISKESKWVLKNYCWSFNKKGYLIAWEKKSKNKNARMHQLLMGPKIEKGFEIDHIDGNKGNNCLDNLRIVTVAQNKWNKERRKDYDIFKTKRNKNNPYMVNIRYKSKRYYLGYYPTLEEARKVRDEWEDNHERKEYFRQEVLNDNN